MLLWLLLALAADSNKGIHRPPLPSIGIYKLNSSSETRLPVGMADVAMHIGVRGSKKVARLANLSFDMKNGGKVELKSLQLNRPQKPRPLKSFDLQWFFYEHCYRLGDRSDSPQFSNLDKHFPTICGVAVRTTHVCVDETSKEDDGTYARLSLYLGRTEKGGMKAVQYDIHMALQTEEVQSPSPPRVDGSADGEGTAAEAPIFRDIPELYPDGVRRADEIALGKSLETEQGSRYSPSQREDERHFESKYVSGAEGSLSSYRTASATTEPPQEEPVDLSVKRGKKSWDDSTYLLLPPKKHPLPFVDSSAARVKRLW
ncbi:hypothetical protein FOZ63_025167 [Perkinsus olseni]|uniref:Uncharacterized protein n=1 Tax=Perkinsus olseni TaxID=32597 RepID=A0A7J6NLW8_PEROL|nr:hypothetical protein FOZ63_025167 [Perkinsus olseni]